MPRLSEDEKNNIKVLLQNGASYTEICRQFNVTPPVVFKLRQSCTDIPDPKIGRPRLLTPQDERVLARYATCGGDDTAVAVNKTLETQLGIKVSDMTVRRALQRQGLAAKEKVEKPKLTPKHVRDRLAFARRHQDWTDADWQTVIFSDETKINRFNSDGRSWCWVRDVKAPQPRTVKQTVKHGGGSVMVWGCITAVGKVAIAQVHGKMDQHQYKSILVNNLLPVVRQMPGPPAQVTFQQDNDPKHTARSVRDWLSQQEFQTMIWPACSPDLNPIEHVWAYIKYRLNQYDRPPKGLIELYARVEYEFKNLDEGFIESLYKSMPRRMEAVIKNGGYWTDY